MKKSETSGIRLLLRENPIQKRRVLFSQRGSQKIFDSRAKSERIPEMTPATLISRTMKMDIVRNASKASKLDT